MSLKGNTAIKIPSNYLTTEESKYFMNREGFIYNMMLNYCDADLVNLAETKNIDILEYQTLFNQKCGRFEKLYFKSLRTAFREKLYDDQIKEFSGNYTNIYNSYNPYVQKYSGAYLKSYQLFD